MGTHVQHLFCQRGRDIPMTLHVMSYLHRNWDSTELVNFYRKYLKLSTDVEEDVRRLWKLTEEIFVVWLRRYGDWDEGVRGWKIKENVAKMSIVHIPKYEKSTKNNGDFIVTVRWVVARGWRSADKVLSSKFWILFSSRKSYIAALTVLLLHCVCFCMKLLTKITN